MQDTEYYTRPYATETYGTPVLAVPIATVFRNGRWQHESLPRLGYISGFSPTGTLSVQFGVGDSHHVRRPAEILVIDETLTQEDLDVARAVALAAAANLKKRSGWVTVPPTIRRQLAREADEAEAAAIHWAQEGAR